MKTEHWLAGVARILQAETADLRELALIGGVDPRTAYIGTRLDGVDIRGQDLRGMIFTDLDLSHVRHDDQTLIDPDQIAATSSRDRVPVLLVSRSIVTPDLEGYLAGSGADVFLPDQLDEFNAVFRSKMRGFAVTAEEEIYLDRAPLDRLEHLGPGLLYVVAGNPASGARDMWKEFGPPAKRVFCTNTRRTGVRLPRASADLKRLCFMLILSWEKLSSQLPGRSIFLRVEEGLAPYAALDASAQLFERIWRSGLQQSDLILAGSLGRESSDETRGIEQLLDPVGFVEFADELCAFVDVETQRRRPRKGGDYSDLAVDAYLAVSGHKDLKPRIFDERGQVLPFGQAHYGAQRRPARLPSFEQMRNFSFADISTVVLVDHIDAASIVDRLLAARELWITPRDLLGAAGAHEVTIWNLIAAQLRRFAGGTGAGVQALMTMTVRLAMQKHINQRSALGILDAPGLSIRSQFLGARDDEVALKVSIAAHDDGALFGGVHFALAIDGRGPRIPDELGFLDHAFSPRPPPISLPPYRAVEEALLAHLLANGPSVAGSVYAPLADRFGLSLDERTVTRPDNSTPLWNNRVQWARRALKDRGYLTGVRGVWSLTPAGVQAAGDFYAPLPNRSRREAQTRT